MLTVLECDVVEPNRKYKKHEADVNNVGKRGVENKTKVTSGKHKQELLTEDIAEGPDQDGSFHHDSEIKNVQTGNFGDDTTECSETYIPVQDFSLAKPTTSDDLSSPNKDNAILPTVIT